MKFYLNDKVAVTTTIETLVSRFGVIVGYNYDEEDETMYQVLFESEFIDNHLEYLYEDELVLVPTANDILKGML